MYYHLILKFRAKPIAIFNPSVSFNHNYLFRRLLLLSIYIRFPKTLAKLDYCSIHNEGHRSILRLGLVEEW